MIWKVVKGLHPATTLTESAEDVVVQALLPALGATLEIRPPLNPDGPESTRFEYEGAGWMDRSQFLIVHEPTGAFWSVDWSDMPSSAALLARHPKWQGTWLCYGWHQARLDQWNIPPAAQQHIWPGFNVGFYPNQLQFREHTPTHPQLMFRDGALKPGQELMEQLGDVLHYRKSIINWPEPARDFGARLCLPGVAALAKRDADCWASGIPTIMLNHGGRLAGDPDCWVSVNIQVDLFGRPIDAVAAAGAIREQWLTIRGQHSLLKGIARSARKYYESYGLPSAVANRLAHTVQQAVSTQRITNA
jgi:hypothetical protein